MTTAVDRATASLAVEMTPRQRRVTKAIDVVGLILTVATVIGGIVWAFPLYWALVTTLKPESEVVQPGVQLWPEHLTLDAYLHVLFNTKMGLWYINSLTNSA